MVTVAHDWTVTVMATVLHDWMATVAHDWKVTAAHDWMLTVAHDWMVTVAHDWMLTVAHDWTVNVAHDWTVTVAQSREPKKVEREPYTGPVVDVSIKPKEPDNPIVPAPTTPVLATSSQNDTGFHSRGRTRGGYRNMQDSTFSLSGMTYFNEFFLKILKKIPSWQ